MSDVPALLLRRVLVWVTAHYPMLRGRVGGHRDITRWLRQVLRDITKLVIPTEEWFWCFCACCSIDTGGTAEKPIRGASVHWSGGGGYGGSIWKHLETNGKAPPSLRVAS